MNKRTEYEIALEALSMHEYARANAEEFDRNRVYSALRVAINELSEKQRAYLTDRYGEHMELREIADRHGVSVSTISRTVKRARKNLWKAVRFSCPAFLAKEEPN